MTLTLGIDIGSGAVKSTLFRTGDGKQEWLAKRCERIRRRDPMTLAEEGYLGVLDDAKIKPAAVDYIATTGEGENVKFATGHFYSMTTHARGGVGNASDGGVGGVVVQMLNVWLKAYEVEKIEDIEKRLTALEESKSPEARK